ncbi:MAG: alpha/beta fold hydrolase [Chloroflexi bacterium]|nr:alpha/beta fold hydrolase [Chloroflexota bacterium]MBP7042786.1 alpha/beta fold hydrolase [Chloroflexota bacterium]
MAKNTYVQPSDLRALSQLLTDATIGITDLVEAVHFGILYVPGQPNLPEMGRTRGIPGLVYKSIRGVTSLVGSGVDAAWGQVVPRLHEPPSSNEREALLAAVNGVWGDYLAESGNALAIPMAFRLHGQIAPLEKQGLRTAVSHPTAKLAILIHGLSMNDRQWERQGHNHGRSLAEEFDYTPIYLHYNSGRHISENGRDLAALLETLCQQWPEPLQELIILGHSMGGLIARSAIHYATAANLTWPKQLQKLFTLGTPHHGAPLERNGNLVDVLLESIPHTAPFARLGKRRSAGITDLRYGNLLDEDWRGADRFAYAPDSRGIVPLPPSVQCFALAATLGKEQGTLKERLLGDGLVPLASALGQHTDQNRSLSFPESQQWIGFEMSHLDLLSRPEVMAQISRWLRAEG